MSARRWTGWVLFGVGVLGLFWLCAVLGSWSPAIVRLHVDVHGASLAGYSVDGALVAPLASQVIADASKDQAVPSPTSRSGGAGGSPTPTASSSVSPSGPGPSPTLPLPSLPSPSLPVSTPTLPPTPSLPVATPSVLPTPPLP